MVEDGTSVRERYDRDGYAAVPAFLPREVADALHGRMVAELDLQRPRQQFVAQGNLLTKPAIEVYSHIYPPLAGFLWGMTPAVESHLGKRLTPTYAYFRIYQGRDVCKVHSDRYACEHSVSLTIATSDNQPWSLSVGAERLSAPAAAVADDFGEEAFGTVAMMPGDAVLYQGVHHRHGRLQPNPNRWSAHVFLHWVDPEGPYREHAFDRPALQAAQKRS